MKILLVSPTPVHAEVMDKEPILGFLLVLNLAIGVVGFLATWRWPRVLLVILPIAVLCAIPVVLELQEPHIGPAIIRETGNRFPLAAAVCVIGPVVGAALALLRKRRGNTGTGDG
jgi:hypothetical protein